MTPQARALVAEAIGTFLFVLIGAGAIVTNELTEGSVGLVGIALAHGVALAILVSIFGAISGGHFNPAVTLGVAVGRAFAWRDVLPYWAVQLAGALAAGYLLLLMLPADAARAVQVGAPAVHDEIEPLTAAGIEAILTLFLVLAVFGTFVSPTAPRIAGFGIGLTVMVDILVGGPLTGAAMNPARWFGPAVTVLVFDDWWVYWVGPLAGAAVAGLAYRTLFPPPPGAEAPGGGAPVREARREAQPRT